MYYYSTRTVVNRVFLLDAEKHWKWRLMFSVKAVLNGNSTNIGTVLNEPTQILSFFSFLFKHSNKEL